MYRSSWWDRFYDVIVPRSAQKGRSMQLVLFKAVSTGLYMAVYVYGCSVSFAFASWSLRGSHIQSVLSLILQEYVAHRTLLPKQHYCHVKKNLNLYSQLKLVHLRELSTRRLCVFFKLVMLLTDLDWQRHMTWWWNFGHVTRWTSTLEEDCGGLCVIWHYCHSVQEYRMWHIVYSCKTNINVLWFCKSILCSGT